MKRSTFELNLVAARRVKASKKLISCWKFYETVFRSYP